jgi:uncharacterized protein
MIKKEIIFPESSPFNMLTRELFLRAQVFSPPSVSDMVFNNLFGWQDYFHYQVTTHGDFLVVFYHSANQMIVLPPLLNKSISDSEWVRGFKKMAVDFSAECGKQNQELVFRFFPEVYTRRLRNEKWDIREERDFFDYIYTRDSLENLSGREYSAKRNLIRQFKRDYSYRYERLEKRHVPAVLALLNKWKPMQANPKMLSFSRYCIACRLVEHFPSLSLEGGLLFVEENLVGLTLASLIPDFVYEDGPHPTAVVHVENALTEYKGSYQMINQLFCSHLPKECMYINREEDLGLAGLRHAKLSYNPVFFLQKHLVKNSG